MKARERSMTSSSSDRAPAAARLRQTSPTQCFVCCSSRRGGDHRCPYYDVPIVQGRVSEDAEMRWDFFVRHYGDEAAQSRDGKYVSNRGGVLYPRASTLGGSMTISALVTIYPHNSNWDFIARLTGNPDRGAEAMRLCTASRAG